MLGSLSCGFHVWPPASQVLILRCAANPGPAGLPASRGKHEASGLHSGDSEASKLQLTPHPCEDMHKSAQMPTRECPRRHVYSMPHLPASAGTSFSGSLQNLRCGRGWGV